jgi:hypothetical protein
MKLHGNETAIVESHRLLFKVGKYRLYKINLRVHTQYFLLDHPAHAQYYNGLKRMTNSFFVCIGQKPGRITELSQNKPTGGSDE